MKLRKRPARRTTRAWNCAPTPVITSCHPSKCISTCVTHFLSLSLSEYVLCFEDVTYVQPFYTCPQHTTPNVVVTCYVATSLHAIHQLKPRITCNGWINSCPPLNVVEHVVFVIFSILNLVWFTRALYMCEIFFLLYPHAISSTFYVWWYFWNHWFQIISINLKVILFSSYLSILKPSNLHVWIHTI